MQHHWSLPWDDTASAVARAHVADSLTDFSRLDDALLITSELVTNAYLHGDEPITIALMREPDHVVIDVEQGIDASRPALITAEVTATSGRGLALVDAIADSWQWSESESRIRVSAILLNDPLG